MKYCIYITIYKGNKLPMFYIGRSSIKNVENGYRGSVSSKLYKDIWIKELEENDHLFKTKILTTHKSQKECAEKEEWFHKKLRVHKNPLYINQATAAGSFHTDISGKKNYWYGSNRSGKDNPMYGKKHSAESREKMSKNNKGKHSQPKTEQFKETLRSYYSGKTFEERFGVEMATTLRENLKKPKSEEHKRKLSDAAKNRPKHTCPHCSKKVTRPNYVQWHGDNCKLRFQELSHK